MVEYLTIDSSVIVASLLQQEKEHYKALRLWEKVMAGRSTAIMPYTVLVEVVAAIRRRTGDMALASEVKKELLSNEHVHFVILDPDAALESSDIAIETGVRGMDAIVIQTAREYETVLVSLDNEMVDKAEGLIKVREL